MRKTPPIAANIARLRQRKGWTQAQLARETGLSRGYIAAVEQGRRHPTLRALAVIAWALEVGIEDLKGGCLMEQTSPEEQVILYVASGEYLLISDGKIYLIKDVSPH